MPVLENLSNKLTLGQRRCLRFFTLFFQVFEVKQAVYEFVTVGAKGRGGGSPLHLACARDSSSVGRYPICVFPSVAAIDLLLECGADPNGKDNVSIDVYVNVTNVTVFVVIVNLNIVVSSSSLSHFLTISSLSLHKSLPSSHHFLIISL